MIRKSNTLQSLQPLQLNLLILPGFRLTFRFYVVYFIGGCFASCRLSGPGGRAGCADCNDCNDYVGNDFRNQFGRVLTMMLTLNEKSSVLSAINMPKMRYVTILTAMYNGDEYLECFGCFDSDESAALFGERVCARPNTCTDHTVFPVCADCDVGSDCIIISDCSGPIGFVGPFGSPEDADAWDRDTCAGNADYADLNRNINCVGHADNVG